MITVKDLFIPDTKIWNKELIEQNFLPWEAESIQGIPISHYPMEDLLIWPHTSGGSYSVKSAYQLLAVGTRSALPSSSTTEDCKPFWKRIWNLQVPNKVKHFMWRASSESLPTKLNLFQRHILPENICSLCEEHIEDTILCLWLCDRVKCIWFSDSKFSPPRSKIFRSFGDLASAVLADASPATTALFLMVAWSIWIRRNKLREKQTVWDVGETVQRARELLQEF
nr:putative ribonuclease h protein [Quercus suber]